jgi:hypothetical protein
MGRPYFDAAELASWRSTASQSPGSTWRALGSKLRMGDVSKNDEAKSRAGSASGS